MFNLSRKISDYRLKRDKPALMATTNMAPATFDNSQLIRPFGSPSIRKILIVFPNFIIIIL